MNVSDILTSLSARIKTKTGCDPWMMDVNPAAIKLNQIYIITPDEEGIQRSNYMSSDSYQEFVISLIKVIHIRDIRNQPDVQCNVIGALRAGENIFKEIVPRNDRTILGANCYRQYYGTKTWVANGLLVTGVYCSLYFKDFVED